MILSDTAIFEALDDGRLVIEGKSSRARLGLLVHFTAPTTHAGWAGQITLPACRSAS